jgi:hypothetical protein
MTQTPPALADAREQFLAMVDAVRPELHRYCARLTGSVIEGGRGRLLDSEPEDRAVAADTRAQLDRYASLFNARDWDGVRALVSDDCRLDLVSKSQRRGKQVGMYFGRYEKENVELRVVRLDGDYAYAAYVAGSERPAYFILLEFADGRVASIRDFRYVSYIATEAEFEVLAPSPAGAR